MDEATQQNATLLEQASVAAKSLEQQAQRLMQEVAIFRLVGAVALLLVMRLRLSSRKPWPMPSPIFPGALFTLMRISLMLDSRFGDVDTCA